jgi:hypothetical protein
MMGGFHGLNGFIKSGVVGLGGVFLLRLARRGWHLIRDRQGVIMRKRIDNE